MKNLFVAAVAVILLVACGEEKPLRGWKSSDVEVINEGSASGSAGHVVAPGETFEPMTSTDVDTTTALDIVKSDSDLEGDFVDDGTLASTIELGEEGEMVSGRPPSTSRSQTSPRSSPSGGTSTTRSEPDERPSSGDEPSTRTEPATTTRERSTPARPLPTPSESAREQTGNESESSSTAPSNEASEIPDEPPPKPPKEEDPASEDEPSDQSTKERDQRER